MKKRLVEILTPLVTTTRAYDRGEVVEWEAGDAERLFKAGYAKPADQAPAPARK